MKIFDRALNVPFWKLVAIFLMIAGLLVVGYSVFFEKREVVCWDQWGETIPCPLEYGGIPNTSSYEKNLTRMVFIPKGEVS